MAVNPNSHIIAVTGGKGGVGKSVFSANLAMAFLTEMKAPTLLVDLDAQSCGDQNVILGLREPRTMADLASNGERDRDNASRFKPRLHRRCAHP